MGTTKWGVRWVGFPWIPWIPWQSGVERTGPHHPSIVDPRILGGAKAHRSHPARANIQRLMITMTKAVI